MVEISVLQSRWNWFVGLFMLDGVFTFIGLSSGVFIERNPFVLYLISVLDIFMVTIVLKVMASAYMFYAGNWVFNRLKNTSVYLKNDKFTAYNVLVSGTLLFYVCLIVYELYLFSGVLM